MIIEQVNQVGTFLRQLASMRLMFWYISLFMLSRRLASALSFWNSSSKEVRQSMVSERESTMLRLLLPIWVISFLSWRILSICWFMAWRSASRCCCSSCLRLAWRCRSSSSCSSFCTFMMRLSILTSRWLSQEQILLTRLLKQVAVLSYMFLKNSTASKSSLKSATFPSGNQRSRMVTMPSFSAPLISSASRITSSLMSMSPRRSFPSLDTRSVQRLTISPHMASILRLLLLVISSMKSLMASLALYERMLRMCLLRTKLDCLIARMMPASHSVGTNGRFLSSFRGCLNSRIRRSRIRQRRKACSSSSNSGPRSVLSSHILVIYRWQSAAPRSRSARLMIKMTPSFMSSKVLKLLSRFLVSLGSLSARASLMWLSSIMRTTLTLGQISSSRCTKKELEISYSSPLLSLKPGQSQKARFSMTILLGTDVSEYFSWPILMAWLGQSSTGLSPSQRTIISAPERKAMMVLLPTPVSPMTMMASWQSGSLGMLLMPLRIISRSFSRFSGVSIQIPNNNHPTTHPPIITAASHADPQGSKPHQ